MPSSSIRNFRETCQIAALPCLLLAMLSACGSKPPPALLVKDIEKIEHVVDTTLPLVQRAYGILHKTVCEEEGGEWKKLGMQQRDSCVLPAADGGKSCTDSKQCEVACVAKNKESHYGARAEGVCLQSTDLFGCHSYVSKGIVEPPLCTD